MALPRARRTPRSPASRAAFFPWLNANAGAIQALAALTAIPIAIVAAVFGLVAFRDQQHVNQDQMDLNKAARERFDRRYASRVAWWEEESGPLWIQNRSPVPIHFVVVYSTPKSIDAGTYASWTVGRDIIPCEAIVVDLKRAGDPAWYEDTISVAFTDSVGHWMLGDGVGAGVFPIQRYGPQPPPEAYLGGQRAASRHVRSRLVTIANVMDSKPLADCGESD